MGGRRQRMGSEAWRALLARHAQSGLSVAAFCAREGVNAGSFYQWRSRLRAGGADAAQAEATARGAFVDLGALGRDAGQFELRLELGGGLVLTLARG